MKCLVKLILVCKCGKIYCICNKHYLLQVSFEEAVDDMLQLVPSRPESPVEEYIAEKVERQGPVHKVSHYKSLTNLDAANISKADANAYSSIKVHTVLFFVKCVVKVSSFPFNLWQRF